MTPEEQLQYAADLILAHAQNIEYLSVFEMAEEYHGEEISDEDGKSVRDLIGKAIVIVTFPGSDVEWSNKDEEE